jgi:nucleotide-binding universal stress UspA family protein
VDVADVRTGRGGARRVHDVAARAGVRLRGTNESLGQGAGAEEVRLLITFEELYPDVVVSTDLVRDDARQVLVPASHHAALLVVGTKRLGRVASSVFGSVSRDLIRRGACPVVVAHSPA